MKRIFIILLLFIFSSGAVFAKTLQGGLSYTVETAREYSFDNIEYEIDMDKFFDYFVDKNKDANLKAMHKKKFKFNDRILTQYLDGSYSVVYKNNKKISYYYFPNGQLESIGFTQKNSNFPKRHIKYTNEGKLDSITMTVSPIEQFMFDADKKLFAHWIGQNCYDENNEFINVRD